ncbi:MAG TPA: DUF5937 family protein [Gaiellaceae bacterium]|nr:DUF5937 family protein [Gaiellaceae bacterium]
MIRIDLPAHPEEHIVFAVSPLFECVLSLHVLLGWKHHALHHAWARRTRAALDPDLRAGIEAFAFVYRTHVPDLFLPTSADDVETFEDELDRLRRLPADVLLPALARPLFDHGGNVNLARDDPDLRASVVAGGGGALVDDPVRFAGDLAELLEWYWRDVFAAEWTRLEPTLASAVVDAAHRLAEEGTRAMLGRLPPHCRLEEDGRALLVDVPHDHAVEISARNPLVLSPSAFVWPHLLVNCDPPWPTAIVFAAPALARDAEPRIPPEELLRVLRALADDTRLRVLELVAARPRTTQELAPLVGLSNAGMSKSLQRLAEAGLVQPRREGYYVVYSLAPARLDALAAALARFLDPA